MSKQVIVTVDRFGDAKVDAEGFTGTSCVEATQAIEQALAGNPVKRNLKPEYDMPSNATEEQTEQMRF